MTAAISRAGLAIASPDAATPEQRLRGIVTHHFDFVWRSLRALGVHEASVDDAAQHVFVIVAQRLAEIAPGSEKSFLFGTARGVAANARRSQAARREVADEAVLLRALDGARNPEEELAHREQHDVLQRILDAMPEDLRVVFVLFELEGMSSIEIAALLGIPTGTAASRLRRAREDFQARVTRTRKGGQP